RVRPEVQTREVEERQEVPVAEVEEEVVRALVVAVLEDVGQREPQHVLVEADGALDVRRQDRDMVDAAGGGRWPGVFRLEMLPADAVAFGFDGREVDNRVGHDGNAPLLTSEPS